MTDIPASLADLDQVGIPPDVHRTAERRGDDNEGQEGQSSVPPTHSFVPGEEIGGQRGQEPVPGHFPDDLGGQAPGTAGTGLTVGPSPRTAWTAAELRDWKFPDPRWAVPGLLPEGVTLLGGAPKIGKSWLALGLAIAIASGGKAFGSIQVPRGDVLYLALEDTGRRLQSRLTKLLREGEQWPEALTLSVECPPLPEGGIERITAWLQAHPEARLVIVDVFERIRGRAASQQSAYSVDYAAVKTAKVIADHFGIAMILIHHVRKAASDDFTELISGTNGLAAAADTIAVLKRSRGELDATLHIVGRDVEENEFAMKFAADISAWQILGLAEMFGLDETRRKILLYVRDHDGATPKEIAEGAGISREAAKKTAQRMRDDGQLDSDGRGRYLIPVPAVPGGHNGRSDAESPGTGGVPDCPRPVPAVPEPAADGIGAGPEPPCRHPACSDTPAGRCRASEGICVGCGLPLDPALIAAGYITHPTCESHRGEPE